MWDIVWIVLFSPFSCQCQNLCLLSLVFITDWRVVLGIAVWQKISRRSKLGAFYKCSKILVATFHKSAWLEIQIQYDAPDRQGETSPTSKGGSRTFLPPGGTQSPIKKPGSFHKPKKWKRNCHWKDIDCIRSQRMMITRCDFNSIYRAITLFRQG